MTFDIFYMLIFFFQIIHKTKRIVSRVKAKAIKYTIIVVEKSLHTDYDQVLIKLIKLPQQLWQKKRTTTKNLTNKENWAKNVHAIDKIFR